MTNDKFRELCEQVLIPRLGDLLHVQLVEMHKMLDEILNELQRVGERVEHIALDVGARYDDEGEG